MNISDRGYIRKILLRWYRRQGEFLGRYGVRWESHDTRFWWAWHPCAFVKKMFKVICSNICQGKALGATGRFDGVTGQPRTFGLLYHRETNHWYSSRGTTMYELIQVSKRSYYIQSQAKIGLVRLEGQEVCLIDSGNDCGLWSCGRSVNCAVAESTCV